MGWHQLSLALRADNTAFCCKRKRACLRCGNLPQVSFCLYIFFTVWFGCVVGFKVGIHLIFRTPPQNYGKIHTPKKIPLHFKQNKTVVYHNVLFLLLYNDHTINLLPFRFAPQREMFSNVINRFWNDWTVPLQTKKHCYVLKGLENKGLQCNVRNWTTCGNVNIPPLQYCRNIWAFLKT